MPQPYLERVSALLSGAPQSFMHPLLRMGLASKMTDTVDLPFPDSPMPPMLLGHPRNPGGPPGLQLGDSSSPCLSLWELGPLACIRLSTALRAPICSLRSLPKLLCARYVSRPTGFQRPLGTQDHACGADLAPLPGYLPLRAGVGSGNSKLQTTRPTPLLSWPHSWPYFLKQADTKLMALQKIRLVLEFQIGALQSASG
ncbi:hypothetical protein NDU88_006897 [Pleurodeles waltl]|uniref:Uncharacterized protein n=1 Tax=Pleurodeles waltl TaxID=8319 RepID=A0AAV7WHN7_PLEWA|nr:hypothetical protein NDU88_006897 [Pleurodeles waltl]